MYACVRGEGGVDVELWSSAGGNRSNKRGLVREEEERKLVVRAMVYRAAFLHHYLCPPAHLTLNSVQSLLLRPVNERGLAIWRLDQ